MKMYVGGQWVDGEKSMPVLNPFDGREIDRVPVASGIDLERAIAGAVRGAAAMRRMAAYDRAAILRRAADAMQARQQELGRLISSEEGKTLAEGVFEASRATETM